MWRNSCLVRSRAACRVEAVSQKIIESGNLGVQVLPVRSDSDRNRWPSGFDSLIEVPDSAAEDQDVSE